MLQDPRFSLTNSAYLVVVSFLLNLLLLLHTVNAPVNVKAFPALLHEFEHFFALLSGPISASRAVERFQERQGRE